MTSSADSVREKLRNPDYGEPYMRGLFTAGFVRSLLDEIWRLHKRQGKKQPHISESTSLERAAYLTIECGVVPLVMFAPIEEVKQYTLDDPTALRTADAFIAWRMARAGKAPDMEQSA